MRVCQNQRGMTVYQEKQGPLRALQITRNRAIDKIKVAGKLTITAIDETDISDAGLSS